ncbi:OstA-like protein [Gaetbulibacter aquiaggeris]|uniref:OstA-like protein n=1 Tax=Gaetbulibacter aquiaggeris TaxID=1735373 RepID=A0ABW7MV39_9FLAO
MNTLKTILFLFCVLAVTIGSKAQDQKKIEIEYSGFLTFNEAEYPGAKILTRDDSQQIHIVHESINMWCDKAYYYGKENFIEAYGHVNLIQGDTINMNSKYIEYSGITKLAFASGDVVLTDPNSTITSDTLYFDREKQQAFYRNGGKVVKDTSGTITSKIGRYYMNLKKYQFVTDVVLVNPDATIKSNYFDFYSDTGKAYLFGPSTITTEESVTYCEKGYYDTKTKIGHALKKSRINYDNRIIEGDSLYFDNNRSFASATNNIKVTDTLNHSIVKGHYAEVFKEKDSVFITKRALAITVQENDSIYMHADTLMVTGKPEKRITRAFRNVRLYKSDMSGKADSVHVNHEKGLTQLINISKYSTGDAFSTKRRPILWNIGNQMTGDTIHLISNPETEKLDSLIVFKNAFLISKDTLEAGFNQIAGQRLVGLFNEENELKTVDVIKNAESIYYFRNDLNELVGIDKAKSGSIKIYLDKKIIEEVKKINQIDGKIYPESTFPDKEKLLKGFDWREEEQLKSIDDLFKDDPPLVLPKITGLDDYVPQEEFFDDAMLERIESADKKSNTNIKQDSKASRNIPKNIKDKKLLLKDKPMLTKPNQ